MKTPLFPWLSNTTQQHPQQQTVLSETQQGLTKPAQPGLKSKSTNLSKLQRWVTGAAKEVGLPAEFTTPEASCLRICVDTVGDYKPFNWDSMSYLLTQLPSVERVEFVGEADALVVIPELANIITQLKHSFPSISVLICTSGEALLTPTGLALLESPLDELRIQLEGHQLSTYKVLTGKTVGDFIALHETVYRYITHRKQLAQNGLIQSISVSYVLNNYQYQKDVPEMLKQAEQLGVDAVHFSNRLPTTAWAKPLQKDEAAVWFEAITVENPAVIAYFETFPAHHYRVAITWPTLWQKPLEWGADEVTTADDDSTVTTENRTEVFTTTCTAPFHTVSINLAFQATGCPRWQIGTLADWHPVWRGDFWQNAHFKQLRTIHTPESSAFQEETTGDLIAPAGFEACKKCPNRCAPSEQAQISPANQHLLSC
jgi:hypothetical protein